MPTPARVRTWHAGVTAWQCDNPHCRRFLAEIVGDTFTTPSGVFGHLPAVIRCPACHERSVRGAALDDKPNCTYT